MASSGSVKVVRRVVTAICLLGVILIGYSVSAPKSTVDAVSLPPPIQGTFTLLPIKDWPDVKYKNVTSPTAYFLVSKDRRTVYFAWQSDSVPIVCRILVKQIVWVAIGDPGPPELFMDVEKGMDGTKPRYIPYIKVYIDDCPFDIEPETNDLLRSTAMSSPHSFFIIKTVYLRYVRSV